MENQEITKKRQYSIEDFKAFNYIFHGKRDTDINVFEDNRKISRIDISDLNSRITNKLNKENIVTNLFSLNLNLNNGNLKEYSNWEVFDRENLNIKEETVNITIEYDFSVQLPFYEIPQRHTLKIRLGGGLRFDEYLKLAFNGSEDHELLEKTADVVCKVDFINYQLANELKNLVKDWYEALPKNKESTLFTKFALRHTKKIEEFFKILFLVIGSLLMYFSSKIFLNSSLQNISNSTFIIDSFYKILLSSAVIIYLFYSMGTLYANRISRKIILRLKTFPILIITKGDENRIEKIKQTNNKQIGRLVSQIIIGITANGITYLVGELLTKK